MPTGSLGFDRKKFSNKGGGKLKVKELANGSNAVTMDFLSILGESGLNIDPNIVEFKDERGMLWEILPGGEIWKWKSTLLQVGKDEIDFIRSYQKYFHMYYVSAPFANGYVQEIYIPLVKISSPLDLKFQNSARNLPIEFTALMPKAALTVTPAGLSVPEDTYGVVVENAAALGEVTTQAGTIYDTIV